VSRPGIGKIVQVYREPIPTSSLVCTDLADGEAVKPGSFHRAFSNQSTNKNAFRVSWVGCDEMATPSGANESSTEQSHTLVAPDEHTKRQWVATIQKTIQKVQSSSEPDGSPKAIVKSTPTRSSPRRLNKIQKKLSGELVNLSVRKSSPKLISASKLMSPTGRTGVFRKKASPVKSTKSPHIKSSLSQSTMDKLQSGGIKKLRRRSKQWKNDENIHRGAIVLDGSVLSQGKSGSSCQLLNKTTDSAAMLSTRRSKSAAVMAAITRKRRPAERRMLQLIDENTRPISKSLVHLTYTNFSPSQASPRYLTRRTAKLSKSMNDLLHL